MKGLTIQELDFLRTEASFPCPSLEEDKELRELSAAELTITEALEERGLARVCTCGLEHSEITASGKMILLVYDCLLEMDLGKVG